MEIAGKVVLITGASRGIGAACAREFHRRGARVAVTARSAGELERAAPEALAVPGDLLDPAHRRRLVEQTLGRFGAIDILINNAGAGLYQLSWQSRDEDVRRMFELNFFAPLDLVRLVVPSMRARKTGTVVNVGSVAGRVTLPWLTLYSATKYALGSFTEGLRMELAGTGIRTITVCPGYVRTAFQEHVIAGSVPEPLVRTKRYFAITPERCAADIAGGVERGARTVMSPRAGWLFVVAARLMPSLVDARLRAIYPGKEIGA